MKLVSDNGELLFHPLPADYAAIGATAVGGVLLGVGLAESWTGLDLLSDALLTLAACRGLARIGNYLGIGFCHIPDQIKEVKQPTEPIVRAAEWGSSSGR